MRAKIVALLAVALIAAVSPAAISLVAGASQAATHANHPTGPPGTIPPCDFDHPTSLPPQASPNATAALDARASHCPTTTAG
jgi:ABC-type oligopeptide transport system substrate-binding subunit